MGAISQGFQAGLKTGGQFGGVGSALKEVLSGLQRQGQMGARIGMQQMSEQGAYARQMLKQSGSGPLPEEMQENYALYGGKPYKTKSIQSEGFPGERAAMGLAYMNYIVDAVKKSGDVGLAAELKTKWAPQKRILLQEAYGGGEGSDMLGTSPQQQPGLFDRFKQNVGRGLRFIGGE